MNKRSSFQDIGLPKNHAYPTLTYHPQTGSIIALTRPVTESRTPCHRLSIRRLEEARYSPIGNFPPQVDVTSFALSPKLPVLYLNTFFWKECELGFNPPGGDWDALYRFNLNTQQSEVVARPGELISPGNPTRVWLNDVISVDENGRAVFCKTGIFKEGKADYFLVKLTVEDRKLELLTRLEAVSA